MQSNPNNDLLVLLRIGAFVSFLLCYTLIDAQYRASCRSATTIAILDESYTFFSRTKFFIPIETGYFVSYKFNVKGELHMGHSTLEDEPTSRIVTVHYNPQKVSDNTVRQYNIRISDIFGAVVSGLSGVGMLLYSFWHKPSRSG